MQTHLHNAYCAALETAGGGSSSIPSRTDYRSVSALCERVNSGAEHPTLSPHALRHYVRNAEVNGLAEHIRRLGRKILISESGFYTWLEGQG